MLCAFRALENTDWFGAKTWGIFLAFFDITCQNFLIASHFPCYWILFLIYYSWVTIAGFNTLVSEFGFCRGFTQSCHATVFMLRGLNFHLLMTAAFADSWDFIYLCSCFFLSVLFFFFTNCVEHDSALSIQKETCPVVSALYTQLWVYKSSLRISANTEEQNNSQLQSWVSLAFIYSQNIMVMTTRKLFSIKQHGPYFASAFLPFPALFHSSTHIADLRVLKTRQNVQSLCGYVGWLMPLFNRRSGGLVTLLRSCNKV